MGVAWNRFHPVEVHIISCHIFRYCRSSRCGRFEVEHLKRYQTRFFNPWKIRRTLPPLSIWESPLVIMTFLLYFTLINHYTRMPWYLPKSAIQKWNWYAGIWPCNLDLKTNVYVCSLIQRTPLYTLDSVSPCLPDTNKRLFIFQSFDRKLIFFKPLCKSLLRHISKDRCCVSAWPVKWQALGMP